MNWAEAIVLIVIASGLAKVVTAALHTGRQRHHAITVQTDERVTADLREALAQNQALRRDVNDLRERIRVLERIATAERQSRDLADEIERLR